MDDGWAARGLVIGIVISLVLWAVILGIGYMLWRLVGAVSVVAYTA